MSPDPLASFRLDGRVAVVTGASSGLGRHFAGVLAAVGASVVVAARRAERLAGLVGELGDDRALAVGCDLAEPDAPDALVAAALERFGRLDVVVNNAGVAHARPALAEDPAAFAADLAVNLVAPFALARAAARVMVDAGHGGSIVNVGSIFGTGGSDRVPFAAYAASKGGLHNLTRELASQWARHGIRVNALAPAWFPSEMTDGKMFGTADGERYITTRTPLGRGGRPDELDGALLLLASDAGSYITGQVLHVDGGWTAV
jgi:hypothetical protein